MFLLQHFPSFATKAPVTFKYRNTFALPASGDEEVVDILADKQYNLTAGCKCTHSWQDGAQRVCGGPGGAGPTMRGRSMTPHEGGGAPPADAPPLASLPQCLKRLTNQPQSAFSFFCLSYPMLPGRVFLHWPLPSGSLV